MQTEVEARMEGVPFLGRVPFDPKMVEVADSWTPFVLQRESKVREEWKELIRSGR